MLVPGVFLPVLFILFFLQIIFRILSRIFGIQLLVLGLLLIVFFGGIAILQVFDLFFQGFDLFLQVVDVLLLLGIHQGIVLLLGRFLGALHSSDLIVEALYRLICFSQGLTAFLCLGQLGVQLLLHGQQLVLLLLQHGRAFHQGICALVQLLLSGFHIPLGLFQVPFLLFQLVLGFIQFAVDGIPDPLIGFVNEILIQDHVQFLLDGTGSGDSCHTGDAFQLVHQGIVQEFCQGDGIHALHGHAGHFHRQHGGIDLQHIGCSHRLFPGSGQHRDLLLNIHADSIHIHGILKFQHDHTDIFTGCGGNFLDMLQGGHGLLHGLCDLVFHLFRRGTGVGGHDHHIGKIHIGQKVRGHLCISHNTQHQNGNDCNEHGQGFLDGKLGHREAPHCQNTALYCI